MSRILLLEDNPGVVRLLRHVLQDYAPIESTNAEEAILRFRDYRSTIQLLIADLTLPISTGIRIALILRCENPDLRILLMSGYPADRWDEQARADLARLGSENVKILQKPFYPEVLVNSIQAMIGAPEHVQVDLRLKAEPDSEEWPPSDRHFRA